MDPRFSHAFPLDGVTRFFILFSENLFFFKGLGVVTYLCFIFLRENKIRKKTLSVTAYLEKIVYGKPKSGPKVRLPIGKVQW